MLHEFSISVKLDDTICPNYRESGAKQLVLSHLMERSLRNLYQNLAAIRTSYSRPVLVANDLECILLTP